MEKRHLHNQCCGNSCDHPQSESVSKCPGCEETAITEHWICTECGRRFGKIDAYFEWHEEPEIEPNKNDTPLVIVTKLLCEDCYKSKCKKDNGF